MSEIRHLTLDEQKTLHRAWLHGASLRATIAWNNPAPNATPDRVPSLNAALSTPSDSERK